MMDLELSGKGHSINCQFTIRSSVMILPHENLIHLEFTLELSEKEAREKIEDS